MLNREDICFIRAKQRGGDYCFEGICKYGYKILIPYKDTNILNRLLREIWFRMKLPAKKIWFNKAICDQKAKIFIVKDPLITPDFLKWIKRTHPESRVVLDYDNRVSMSVSPVDVPENIEKWSYDQDDCKKYNLKFKKGTYLDIYAIPREKKQEYDIIYLGKDKGRAKEILELEKKFNQYGLRTNFRICPDRSFMILKKRYYKPYMTYSEYLQILGKSKAVLNIVQPGQTSITMREYEAIFDNIKCITNNPGILKTEFYHKSRYFVLGVDNFEKIVDFLEEEFKPLERDILDKYRFETYISEIVSPDKMQTQNTILK